PAGKHEHSCVCHAQETGELPERTHDPNPGCRLGATELVGDLVVAAFLDDAELERVALCRGKRPQRARELFSSALGLEPLIDRQKIELIGADRHPEALSGHRLDPAPLVVAAHEVLRDSVEPGSGRAAGLVAETT